MSHNHTVEPGDTLSSIAKANNFANFLTIWNDAGNAGLRALRHDPHILQPGDVVFVPDLPENVAHGANEQRHVFALESPALLLNVRIEDLDAKPVANAACTLRVDAKDDNGRESLEDEFDLTTDKNGKLSQEILEDADLAELKIGDDHILIVIGGLDPVRSDRGMQARLNNLGYFAGFNELDREQLRWAIEEFQHDNDIKPPNGDLDDKRNTAKIDVTKNKLGQIHGDHDRA
ncbi:MAG: LysM peptidoglycan-binding domain-containing protein [Gemmatimonadaceae bacterium]|nr:LysM peptidoglycan-binding domain-containing protein [Gemmatimonadaceae bacterium]